MATLRSSRRDQPRRRYTVDAFDSIQDLLDERGSGSDSPASDSEEDAPAEDESEEDEFQANAGPSDADDDSMSGLEDLGPLEEVDDTASGDGDMELDDDISIASDPDQPTMKRVKTGEARRSKHPILATDGQILYERGLPENDVRTASKINRRLHYFGPTPADWKPIYWARDRWEYEPCLPSRIEQNGRGGLAYSEPFRTEINKAEANWTWYGAEGGRAAVQERQALKSLSSGEASEYLAMDGSGERSFVAGPVADQKLYNMRAQQFMVMSEPFHTTAENGNPRKTQHADYKSGFILNLGSRVNCLDWAPNMSDAKQYLAVSLLPRREPDLTRAPAFSPQKPHKSSIQIWEFCAGPNNFIDKTIRPQLALTLCTEAGDVKALKWCPVPKHDLNTLGLLACIFGDGALHVFDLSHLSSSTGPVSFLVERPAFKSKPPNTICTSIAWLSSSRIAASCANGFVAVWDLSTATKSNQMNPHPEIYASISTGYIISIASCYPSFPHMVVSTSMSGYVSLHDLHETDPGGPSGTVTSHRSRVGQYHVVWHELSRSGISVEENSLVKANPFRRWFNPLNVGRVKSHATSIASSPCHPFVLIGCASGEVVGTNPVRKVVNGVKTQVYQQNWFLHEWRRPNEEEKAAAQTPITDSDSAEQNEVKSTIGKGGLSRFVDGFKAMPTDVRPGSNNINHLTRSDGRIITTIYEEKTAVTALAWNPNVHVGGWAAAGMGDGLLRVEDIAS